MKLFLPALLLGLSSVSIDAAPVKGELSTVGIAEQGNASVRRPRNAQTKESVLTQFGEPDNRVAAVGEPPISRWEYAQFNVYFEYDRVIHAVLKK